MYIQNEQRPVPSEMSDNNDGIDGAKGVEPEKRREKTNTLEGRDGTVQKDAAEAEGNMNTDVSVRFEKDRRPTQ